MKFLNTAILLALLCTTSAAFADTPRGMLLSPDALESATRSTLETDIAAHRTAAPAAFVAIENVVREAAAIDAEKRGQVAPFARIFQGMGPGALLPLLEIVAVRGPARGTLTESAWSGLRAGAIQAIGKLRNPRAIPIMTAVLASDESDFLVRREAARALGRMGTEAIANTLIAESALSRPHHAAVLDGMGWCRRAEVAVALSQRVPAAEAHTLPHLLTALTDIGNGWAWRTSEVRENADHEMPVRATAGKALLAAFMELNGPLRVEARKGLLVVDHPDTLAWIATAQSTSSPEMGALLGQLADRVKRSPFRR
jgi:hypothetical protein